LAETGPYPDVGDPFKQPSNGLSTEQKSSIGPDGRLELRAGDKTLYILTYILFK
jgi:hypothetical protein